MTLAFCCLIAVAGALAEGDGGASQSPETLPAEARGAPAVEVVYLEEDAGVILDVERARILTPTGSSDGGLALYEVVGGAWSSTSEVKRVAADREGARAAEEKRKQFEPGALPQSVVGYVVVAVVFFSGGALLGALAHPH